MRRLHLTLILILAVLLGPLLSVKPAHATASLDAVLAQLQSAVDTYHARTGAYPTDLTPNRTRPGIEIDFGAASHGVRFVPDVLPSEPDQIATDYGLWQINGETLYFGVAQAGQVFATQDPPADGQWTSDYTIVYARPRAEFPTTLRSLWNSGPERHLLTGAVYYAYPSEVNGSDGDLEAAARVFAHFDYVVLGAGLEDPSHPDHANTVRIIELTHQLRPTTRFAGYIDLGVSAPWDENYSLDQLRQHVEAWRAMGVDGILWDDAGMDFGVSRDRLNYALDLAHEDGLFAVINAWNPDDVFSTAGGLAPPHVLHGDLYVLESFDGCWYCEGSWPQWSYWEQKAAAAQRYAHEYPVGLWALSSYPGNGPSEAQWEQLQSLARQVGATVVGAGTQYYSAASGQLWVPPGR